MEEHSKHLIRQRECWRQRIFKRNLLFHEKAEKETRMKILTDKLVKTSDVENCLSAQLLTWRLNRETYARNVIDRAMRYDEKKNLEFQKSLEREQALNSFSKILSTASMDRKMMLHNVLLLNNKEVEHNKHFLVCRRTVEDIIDLSIIYSELKKHYDGNIPKDIYYEKLDLFMCQVPIFSQGVASHDFFESQSCMDFQDYLNQGKAWQCNKDLATNKSKLNHIISLIFDAVHHDMGNYDVLPTNFNALHFPQFSLKVCLLGGPHSGKSTCCQMLAMTFRLQVIAVNNVVNEAIKAFNDSESIVYESGSGLFDDLKNSSELKHIHYEPLMDVEKESTKNNITSKLTKRAELGKEALESLELGCLIKDETVIEMLVEYIRRMPENGMGWILDGFPSTIRQLYLFEKALTGCDPMHKNKASFKSQILSVIEKSKEKFKSAIDVALVIDVPDEIIINRSHIDQGSINNLMNGLTSENMQVLQSLEVYQSEIPKLVEWFKCYGRLGHLNGCADIGDMIKEGSKILSDVMVQLSSAYTEIEKGVKEHEGSSETEEIDADISRTLHKSEIFPMFELDKCSARLILDSWGYIEDNYVTSCQLALRWLRGDDQEMAAYFYQIRNDFKELFRKPDCISVTLLKFQKDFNSLPLMLRKNENVKAELCQRVDDLQVKLWKLSDEKRKRMELQICLHSTDLYLTHCLSSVNNHLIQLINIEVSKLENILNLLGDISSYTQADSEIGCLTLNYQEIYKSPNSSETKLDSTNIKNGTRFVDGKRSKLRSIEDDERSQILNISEVISDAKTYLDKMKETLESLSGRSHNDDFSPKNNSKIRSLAMKTSQFVDVEDGATLDDKSVLVKELCICMKNEIDITRERINMIENRANRYGNEMQITMNNMLDSFRKWIATNYLSEMQSIDLVCEMARNCSEHGCSINDLLSIKLGDLFFDESFKLPILPQENDQAINQECSTNFSGFTICQLFSLFHRFMEVAPVGLISKEVFLMLFQCLANDGGLPNHWLNNFPDKIEIASRSAMYNNELISWRKFIMLSINPTWPMEEDLSDALLDFNKIDQLSTGYLTKEQFLKAKIWLDKDRATVKEFLFHLFACHQNIPSLLDYEAFLLNFCLDIHPENGLKKALKLGSSFGNFNQNSLNKCGKHGFNDGGFISAHVLYKILYPLPVIRRQGSRFYDNGCKMEELLQIFRDLGGEVNGEKLPIKLITEHPSFQRAAENTNIFWLDVNLRF